MLIAELRRRELGLVSVTAFRRTLYEAVVPSATAYDISDCPNATVRRFTPDGSHLIAFSRNHRDILVYRFEGGGHRRSVPPTVTRERPPSRPTRPSTRSAETPPPTTPLWPGNTDLPAAQFNTTPGIAQHQTAVPPPLHIPENTPIPATPVARPQLPRDVQDLDEPMGRPYTCPFARFFTLVYQRQIASGSDILSKDFCLVTDNSQFLVLGSWVADPDGDTNAANYYGESANHILPTAGAVGSEPAILRMQKVDLITLHLVDLATGHVLDRFCLPHDLVQLDHHLGVHFYDNALVVLSMRHQVIHIIKIRESGSFAEIMRLGRFCRDDDELEVIRVQEEARRYMPPGGLSTDSEKEAELSLFDKDFVLLGSGRDAPNEVTLGTGLGNGLARSGPYEGLMQRILTFVFRREARRGREQQFFHQFRKYCNLVMFKAQMLDTDHILIRLGPSEYAGVLIEDPSAVPWAFAVFRLSQASVVAFVDGRPALDHLLVLYHENMNRLWLLRDNFIQPVDPEASTALRALRAPRYASVTPRAVGAALYGLPVSAQSHNLSPYLCPDVYSYDERRLGALVGSRSLLSPEYPTVKFTSRRSGTLRFKLTPGKPAGSGSAGRSKKLVSFLFHPWAPFVISTQNTPLQQTSVNFHYRL